MLMQQDLQPVLVNAAEPIGSAAMKATTKAFVVWSWIVDAHLGGERRDQAS
jgi:hypothetical protein